MTCTVCKQSDTAEGRTTVTLERGSTVVVFRDVPADVCRNCGEAYVSEEVAGRLLEEIASAAKAGVSVDVRRYAA